MSYNSGFDYTGFTGFPMDNDLGYDNSGVADYLFNMEGNNTSFDLRINQYAGTSTTDTWYLQPSDDGSTSQHYTGVEVLGGLNGLSYFNDPVAASATSYPQDGVSFDQGKSSPSLKMFNNVHPCQDTTGLPMGPPRTLRHKWQPQTPSPPPRSLPSLTTVRDTLSK
jgi:hypothetical protein